MSKENLDQFIQKVADSEELQARIGEEMDADSLIALGAMPIRLLHWVQSMVVSSLLMI